MDENADAGVEEREIAVEGRAAGTAAAHPAAERRAQLAVHRLLVEGVLEPQIHGGTGARVQPLPLDGEGVVLGDAHRTLEQRSPARLLGLAQEVLVDLLEDIGDTEEERRPERPQRGGQRLLGQLRLVREEQPAAQTHSLDHQAVDVRERQEGEDRRPFAGRRGGLPPPGEQDVAGAGQAAVGERAAPGPAGRAGRVRDHGGGVRHDDAAQRVHRRVRHVPARLDEVGQGLGVQLPDVPQQRELGAHRADRHHARLVLDHHAHTGRVPQDPLDLVARRRRIDRHDLGAHGPQRDGEHRPLVPGPRHHGHPVARPDPGRDQPLGQSGHFVPRLGRAHPCPGAGGGGVAARDLRQSGITVRRLEQRIGQPSGHDRARRWSNTEVAHATLRTFPARDLADGAVTGGDRT